MISLKQVDFSYHRQPFLQNLNLSVTPGRITTIIGPNGSGKSTVLKLAAGLLSPSAGQILYREQSLASLGRKAYAQKVGLVLQQQRPVDMTVERLVMAGRFPHQSLLVRPQPEDQEAVEQALTLTGSLPLRKKNLRQLSGGELQRAYLAMAVAQDTEVLLLDEPTAHLDLHVCHEIMELVLRLKQDYGKTVVLVLHDLNLALNYSERLVVMAQGQVKATGSCQEVLKSGIIQQVFGVELKRFASAGKEYYCFDVAGESAIMELLYCQRS